MCDILWEKIGSDVEYQNKVLKVFLNFDRKAVLKMLKAIE